MTPIRTLLVASVLAASLGTSTIVRAADAVGEANKKIVLAFYDAGLVRLDAAAAVQYLGPTYKQHNPMAPDGVEGFKGFIAFLAGKYPQRSTSIKRVMADGDLVMLHVHSKSTPEDRGNAIVDIFRVENGKIVEHWDVIQPVPEKQAHGNTMF